MEFESCFSRLKPFLKLLDDDFASDVFDVVGWNPASPADEAQLCADEAVGPGGWERFFIGMLSGTGV